jgi:hypothetical protein
MDYGDPDRGDSLWDILRANFDATYYGNRAPFPIYIHTPWLNGKRSDDLKRFAGGVKGKGGRGEGGRTCMHVHASIECGAGELPHADSGRRQLPWKQAGGVGGDAWRPCCPSSLLLGC